MVIITYHTHIGTHLTHLFPFFFTISNSSPRPALYFTFSIILLYIPKLKYIYHCTILILWIPEIFLSSTLTRKTTTMPYTQFATRRIKTFFLTLFPIIFRMTFEWVAPERHFLLFSVRASPVQQTTLK